MINLSLSDTLELIAVLGIIGAVIYGVLRFIHYILSNKQRNIENYHKSFDTIVAQLSSDNHTSQLSAAILLRRFFEDKTNQKEKNLHDETINVMSSLIKTLPTGVFQKTVGDGLAYAKDLSYADLQKTNLQDVYLGKKQGSIMMHMTDMFMADLSYALLENIEGVGAIFYHAVLSNTQIKNCNFTKANFVGADLSNARFKNVILDGANFSDAINIPNEIASVLNEDSIVKQTTPISTTTTKKGKSIFFSMPGCMSKEDEMLTRDYKQILEAKGYDVIYYKKDDYPEFGQFTKVKKSIMNSSAMIAFGLKQINIKDGSYHPNTTKEESINDKWLPTPWNGIEVGMGLMANLPILLVKDKDIDSGIFDAKLTECFVGTIPSDFDCRKLETSPVFTGWLEKF